MMRPSLVPFCLFLTLLGPTDGLYIASFNIQIFGMTKFDNQEVVNILAQVNRSKLATNSAAVEPRVSRTVYCVYCTRVVRGAAPCKHVQA